MKNKIKILLIDDNETMRIYFKDIFWIHGKNKVYDVDVVHSLEEAQKKIDNVKTRPNTIFLDIILKSDNINNNLGEQLDNAVSFIENIKKNDKNSDIRIIIFSNSDEKDIKKKFPTLQVDGYIKKGEIMPKEIIDYTDKIHGANNKN